MKRCKHVYVLLFFSYSLFSMETDSERKRREKQDTTIEITVPGTRLGNTTVVGMTSGGLTVGQKVAPKDLHEVQNLIRSRSAQPNEIPKRRVVPQFQQNLEDIHQEQQEVRERKVHKKKTFTRAEVEQMVAEKKKRLSIMTYTEDEVAEILKQAESFDQQVNFAHPQITSRMHELGKKYNVPLEQLPAYAELLHGVEISPRILANFVYTQFGEGCEPHETIVAGYEKYAEKKPEKYQELVFAMMQAFVDEVGKPQHGHMPAVPAIFADAHVDVLERRIEDQGNKIEHQGNKIEHQGDTLYKTRMALVMKFLALVGTTAWALYGQINPSLHSCPVCPGANVTG